MQNSQSKEHPRLFFLSLVTRILQGASPAAGRPDIRSQQPLASQIVGTIIGNNSPTAEMLYLGHHYPLRKGQGERGGIPVEAIHVGIHFFQLLLKPGRGQRVQFRCSPGMLCALPSPRTGICMTRFDEVLLAPSLTAGLSSPIISSSK